MTATEQEIADDLFWVELKLKWQEIFRKAEESR